MKKKIKSSFPLIVVIVVIALLFGCRKYVKYAHLVYYYVSPIETYIDGDKELSVDTDTINAIDNGYGDWLVHPCVRYFPEGFGGHKWWMAITPYPEGDSKYEQPILYYGEDSADCPPEKWSFFGIIQDVHASGYNADPSIFYDKVSNMMYIIWKECRTPNTISECNNNAIMYRTFNGYKLGDIKKLLDNCSDREIKLTAPTLIQIQDSIYCFATDFEHERDPKAKLARGRCGIAVWKNAITSLDSINFTYTGRKEQIYPEWFDYWHTEFIYDETENLYYSTVTNENGFDILFGISQDGFHYTYSDKPLISIRDKNHSRNLYKSSIVVIDDKVYVFYPKRSKNRRTVHIYCSCLDKRMLINNILQ